MDKQKTLPFTCPICGRKTEHPLDALSEGAGLTCPFCKLKLTLHGHMWQEIKGELEKAGVVGHGSRVKAQGPDKGK
jgi:DNA-directed RNA polymerase subunit RPC12/RpoP